MSAPAPSPAGTPMQSWLEKWSEWEIQAVVAISFGLQIILFFFAGIRRYSHSSVLKVLLWLVYLLADAAAIYALGHMSASLSKTSTDKHDLVAFWAPFLLLHLGGQDTISAYALEDNELWLRHLLNISVQVAGTGYVLHKYIIADRETIVSAAVLISVAGFVKYGERIWALKYASKGSRGANRPRLRPASVDNHLFSQTEKVENYEFIAMAAHEFLYDFVKPLITGSVQCTAFNTIREIERHEKRTGVDVSAPDKWYSEEVYRVIEMQLALAYDMLYTKAQVIHTWYGYLIRGISFVSCFGALVAFTRSKRDRYCTQDIVITFVLLGGACALEVASVFKVIGSTWTYRILRGYGWKWLAKSFLFLRYHLVVVKDGRWSNSVGQYDFISFCASDKTKLKSRIAGWIGLKDWWNKAHHTKHAKLSPALKQFVWSLLRGKKSDMVEIYENGDLAIRRVYWSRTLTGFDQCEEVDWSLRLEFHNCVLIWHIATSTFLRDPAIKSELVDTGMAEMVNTLSDYMMYLLVQYPDILPMNPLYCFLFEETYKSYNFDITNDNAKREPYEIIMGFEESHVLGGDQRINIRLRADLTSLSWNAYEGEAELVKASILVRTLLSMKLELTHKLVIIGRVWTEMLCYTATRASGDFHARQLSNGGEFLTHMLFLNKYCSTLNRRERNLKVAAHVEPMVEAGDHVELDVQNDSEDDITESR